MSDELLKKLAEPFPPEEITWKPGHTTKDGNKCMAMAYADLRAYQDRLDEVCGMDWSVRYETWGDNRLMAYLTIAGVTRASTGESNAQDEKNGMAASVAEAQAFKRAAAMFGCGRYLYELPSEWVDYDAQARRISKAGQIELDKRYNDWYRRATGEQKPAPVAHVNGNAKPAQKPATAQKAPATPDNPFVDQSATLARLIELGQACYGEQWEQKAQELAEHATTGNTRNITELTEDERKTLIDGITKKLDAQKQAA